MGITKAERQLRAEARARRERDAAERQAAYKARIEAEARAKELAALPGRVRDLRRALELLDTLDDLLGELACLTECPMPIDDGAGDRSESVPVDALSPSTLAATIAEQLGTLERKLMV